MEKTVSDYFNGEISSQAERKAPQIFFKIAEAEAAFAHSQVGEPGFSNTHEKNRFRVALTSNQEGAGQRKAQDSGRRRTAEGAGQQKAQGHYYLMNRNVNLDIWM